MGEANFYYFTCLKLLSHLDLPLSVTLGEMAPLFVIAAFLTLTLFQSASGSNGTETTIETNETDVTAESASVGELRLGSGVVRPGPVMRERAPPVCRTRYLYHPEKADWEGAKMLCEMEGGQLAVITSEAEQGRIASRFGRLPEFWVGCTDIEREGQFRWVNGQGLGFARWYSSQPSRKYPNNEHCVTFNYWGKDAKWGDRNCYDSRPFLCETMVCKPARGRFPSGYPGAFKGPLRRPYEFPRNQNHPGPKGMGGQAVRSWSRGGGQPYNEWERIRSAIHN